MQDIHPDSCLIQVPSDLFLAVLAKELLQVVLGLLRWSGWRASQQAVTAVLAACPPDVAFTADVVASFVALRTTCDITILGCRTERCGQNARLTVEYAFPQLLLAKLTAVLFGELFRYVLFTFIDHVTCQNMLCVFASLVHVVATVTNAGILATFLAD